VGLPNLKLGGGSYHWRRKIMVAGRPLPLSISLRMRTLTDLGRKLLAGLARPGCTF